MTTTSNSKAETSEGPDINLLHHRLTDFPREWLDRVESDGFIAIIHDAVYCRNPDLKAADLEPFRHPPGQCDWYRLSLLIAYFIADDSFTGTRLSVASLVALLTDTAQELASAGPTAIYIDDVDRREEFIRVVLNAIGLRPAGESENQAEDRLQAASSQERLKVLHAARAAEERSRKLREKLAEKKAQESADKMMRE
jgi:hypothetical protein